ncbi:hypothetical protein SOVF_013990 [Spinacia oleracea]|nr:hypothetical protein SOVF_013990 [Spinacia oleracea]
MVPGTATSSPHSGHAFAIFKTPEAAKKIIGKLALGCLMLPNGRLAEPGIIFDKKEIFKLECSRENAPSKAWIVSGAGDAFVGGFLNILVSDLKLLKDEKRLKEALYFANACGAVTVTKRGAIPGLPTKDEVLQILQQVLITEKI